MYTNEHWTVLGRLNGVTIISDERWTAIVFCVPYYYSIGIVFGALVSLLGLYWIEIEKNKIRDNTPMAALSSNSFSPRDGLSPYNQSAL